MRRRWLIPAAAIVALLQISFLTWMIVARAHVLRTGDEVMLQVEPIDPRDLLRGDYVILGYNISQIPTSLFEERPQGEGRRERRSVYVRLREGDNGIWQPVAAKYDERPSQTALPGDVDIRGEARGAWYESMTEVTIRYGIERFYVPEGEGREIERGMGEGRFRVALAVAQSGTAQIKALYDGETRLYEEPLY